MLFGFGADTTLVGKEAIMEKAGLHLLNTEANRLAKDNLSFC